MFRVTLLAALVVAFGVRADAPKADLSDLKDAVRAADKRGANVEPIKAALAALEKALAKGATEAAPPELAALRDTVEAAVKKGEKVDGISDELSAVEKALTGKGFERPKGPEQKLEPEPAFPNPGFPNRPFGGRPGGIVINGGGRVVIGGGAGTFNSTAVTISGGTFTIRAKRAEVFFVVTGTPDGKTKIEITDGDTKTDTDDVAKVPEKHKAAVEQLLKMVNRN